MLEMKKCLCVIDVSGHAAHCRMGCTVMTMRVIVTGDRRTQHENRMNTHPVTKCQGVPGTTQRLHIIYTGCYYDVFFYFNLETIIGGETVSMYGTKHRQSTVDDIRTSMATRIGKVKAKTIQTNKPEQQTQSGSLPTNEKKTHFVKTEETARYSQVNTIYTHTRGFTCGRERAAVEANARRQRKTTTKGSLRCQGPRTNIRLIPDAIKN